jgi:hypothetical protein
VAAFAVPVQQRVGGGQHDVADALLDKRLLQRREIGGAAPAQGRENEAQVGVDIELAALVVGIEAIVLCREAVRVDEPVAAQELPPA